MRKSEKRTLFHYERLCSHSLAKKNKTAWNSKQPFFHGQDLVHHPIETTILIRACFRFHKPRNLKWLQDIPEEVSIMLTQVMKNSWRNSSDGMSPTNLWVRVTYLSQKGHKVAELLVGKTQPWRNLFFFSTLLEKKYEFPKNHGNLKPLVVWRSKKKTCQTTHPNPSFLQGEWFLGAQSNKHFPDTFPSETIYNAWEESNTSNKNPKERPRMAEDDGNFGWILYKKNSIQKQICLSSKDTEIEWSWNPRHTKHI